MDQKLLDARCRGPGHRRRDDRASGTRPARNGRIGGHVPRQAHQATQEGLFDREILPIQVDGETYATDQGIRPDTPPEGPAELRPAFKRGRRDHGGQLVADLRRRGRRDADERGRPPTARPQPPRPDRRPDAVGCRPTKMLDRPDPGDPRILERNGMSDRRYRLLEVNEAFASVSGRVAARAHPDMDRVNPRGGRWRLAIRSARPARG